VDAIRRDAAPPAHPSKSVVFMGFQGQQKPRTFEKLTSGCFQGLKVIL